MRLLFLTPGTGSFFCGTCLRDNALALALRRRGHDAMLVPMYLPPTLDEASAADSAPLIYGGVKVYLRQFPLFRHAPGWVDKLLDSKFALAGAAKRAGMTHPKTLGPMTLSMLKGENGDQARDLDSLIDWLKTDGRADAVILSNSLLMGLGRRIKNETGAKTICTLQGEDTFLDALPEPFRTDCWKETESRARDFDALVAVSRYHADLMTRRANLPPERVHVVHNGITLDGYGPAPTPPAAPTLGFLSRMCPPKGLHLLVDAFVLLAREIPDARLRVAGAQTDGDIVYVNEQKEKLRAAGILDRAEFLPNIDRSEKIAFLQSLTALSVPAMYGESFGLYLLESLAAGVPVVQPNHAAFPEVLAQTDGGVLFDVTGDPAKNAKSLADAALPLLKTPEGTRALGERGRRNVVAHFGVDTMAENIEAILRGL